MDETIKKTIKKIIPNYIIKSVRTTVFRYRCKQIQSNHKIALAKIRNKEKVKVVFFLIHESVWKYEELFKLMEEDNRFDPVVVVCPYITYGDETMISELRRAYDSFKAKGYNVIKSLDEDSGKWLDVKNEIKPDIVFFTNPHNLTREEYFITNFLDTLTCYVPYGFKNSYLYEAHFDQLMQNYTWRFFLETNIHKKLSLQYARNKSVNTLVTGYPGMDKFLRKDYQPVDVWKIKDRELKRIIWAPHHTIPGRGATLDYSTFLKYFDFMLNIATKYLEHIQIAFKPHPILRANLSLDEFWGKEKTDKYYQAWAELPNGQVHEGGYIDLFLTSDGMIHDSSSFVIEYLYTNNPVMFLLSNDSVLEKFNELGKMALGNLYIGKSKEEIEEFVINAILNGKDIKQEERLSFFNSVVKPPNNVSASENIYNHIVSEIFKNTPS
jgi:hypothetical protein